jgi:tetratricopeptide (TPR) repeat protein
MQLLGVQGSGWRGICIRWLLCCVLLAGCAKQDSPVVAGMESSDAELVDFIQQHIDSVRDKPDSGLRRGQLAMAYDTNGFHDAAEVSYAQAAAIDGGDFRWPYFRALSLATLGRLPEAIESMESALLIDVGYPQALLSKGNWLLDLDRHQEAGVVFEQAIAVSEDRTTRAPAQAGLARTLMRQDRNEEAALLLERLAADLTHPYVTQLLGSVYRRLGRDPPAVDPDTEVTALTWPDPRQNVKRNYLRGAVGKMLLAEKMLAAQQPEKAVELLAPLLAQAPRDRDILNNLGIAYRLTGQTDKAVELLMRGLEVDPGFHQYHFNLALIHEDQGDDDLALEHLGKTIELMPTLVQAHQRVVEILVRQSRFSDAMAALDAARQYGAADANTLFYAGLVAGAQEQWHASIKYFEQSIQLDPKLAKSFLYLGRSLTYAQRYSDAETALAQAEALGVAASEIAAARRDLAAARESGLD